jgi:hypothetical protein
VAEQIATRYGPLAMGVSQAVLQTIILVANNSLEALNLVYLELQPLREQGSAIRVESPGQRWDQLLLELWSPCGSTPSMIPNRLSLLVGPCDVVMDDVVTTADEERTIGKLLTEVASFLLAESTSFEEESDFFAAAVGVPEAELDRLQGLLECASNASVVLLRNAGEWRSLYVKYAKDRPQSSSDLVRKTPPTAPATLSLVPDWPKSDSNAGHRPLRVLLLSLLHRDERLVDIQRPLQRVLDEIFTRHSHTEVIVRSQEPLVFLEGWFQSISKHDGGRRNFRYAPDEFVASSTRDASGLAVLLDRFRDAVYVHHPDIIVLPEPHLPFELLVGMYGKLDGSRFRRRSGGQNVLPDLRGCGVVIVEPFDALSQAFWGALCEEAGAHSFGLIDQPYGRSANLRRVTYGRARPANERKVEPRKRKPALRKRVRKVGPARIKTHDSAVGRKKARDRASGRESGVVAPHRWTVLAYVVGDWGRSLRTVLLLSVSALGLALIISMLKTATIGSILLAAALCVAPLVIRVAVAGVRWCSTSRIAERSFGRDEVASTMPGSSVLERKL